MNIFRLFLILSVLFVLQVSLFAADAGTVKKGAVDEPMTFSFVGKYKPALNIGLSNEIENYRSRSSGADKVRSFRIVGIVGAVVFGVGFVGSILGAVLIGVGYSQMIAAGIAFSITGLYGGALTVFIGAILLALSQVLFWVGLPVMIVGFAVSAYHSRGAEMQYKYVENKMAYETAFVFRL